MKRDMDLIREILLRIEKAKNPPKDLDLSFSQHDEQVVNHHLQLLFEAKLIRADDLSDLDGKAYRVNGLTTLGHNYLEELRNS